MSSSGFKRLRLDAIARLQRIPKPALAGAAALVAAGIVGICFWAFTVQGQPAFTLEPASGQTSAEQDAQEPAGDAEVSEEADDGEAAPAGDPVVMLAVYVSGAVVSPGVYAVPEGSRVCDVVALAGGLRDDAAQGAVNLARKVSDGEQIAVPTQDEAAAGPSSSAASSSAGDAPNTAAAGGPVNINTASVEQLDTLPGVGPATAQAIVDERTANGPFASVEDIQRVAGIGEKKYEKLKESICV